MNGFHRFFTAFLYLAVAIQVSILSTPAQEAAPKSSQPQASQLVERKPPPPIENFETDTDPEDGTPDGWYNNRGASLVSPGHASDRCLRLENDKPSRPARISYAFGVDGKAFMGLKISAWVKVKNILPGDHQGEDPGIMIDFLNAELLTDSRGLLGPFNDVTIGEDQWFLVSKVLPLKETTLDAILSIGLLGATGMIEIDDLTFEFIPRNQSPTTNFVLNSSFELGDWKPEHWSIEGSARRASTGDQSPMALELGRGQARALSGLGRKVDDAENLTVKLSARAQGLRSATGGGAALSIYFVDDRGKPLPNRDSVALIRFSGSFAWTKREASTPIPPGAVGAIVQLEKLDAAGELFVDNLSIESSENPARYKWSPLDIPLSDESDNWPVFQPFSSIEPSSVLDTTQWGLSTPKGQLRVNQGRLTDSTGSPVRLWGVSLLPTAAFPEESKAAPVASLLHSLGVNVVRFGDLDYAFGPGRSLIDDVRDDTSGLDEISWERMSLLQAELAKRGIYYAVELHSHRKFREGDNINYARQLPTGGGPGIFFDKSLTTKINDLTLQILTSPRPAQNLPLAKDPHLAWLTMTGENSLIDFNPALRKIPQAQTNQLEQLQRTSKSTNTKKFHRDLEKSRLTDWLEVIQKTGISSPIAGISHWQRDSEWQEGMIIPGINLVDDRFYWPYAPWSQPQFRSAIYDQTRSFALVAASKRSASTAYILSQWCSQTQGAWALPGEAVDILLGAYSANVLDFDGLVRRGLAIHPELWGNAATGTSGNRDIFPLAESIAGMPQMLAVMPHAASIVRRARTQTTISPTEKKTQRKQPARKPVPLAPSIKGWAPADGTARIETTHTIALAGNISELDESQTVFGPIRLDFNNNFGLIAASSATSEPLEKTNRILVTILGRATPTGLKYTDQWQKEVFQPGTPPLRIEPVTGTFTWSGQGKITAYAVDNSGKRLDKLTTSINASQHQVLKLDSASHGTHVEIVIAQ